MSLVEIVFLVFWQTIKTQIQTELLDLVAKTTQHILAIRPTLVTTELTQLQHPLLELLELVYAQFKLIASAHGLLLKHFLSAAQRHSVTDARPYDISDFWTQAQAVVSNILFLFSYSLHIYLYLTRKLTFI